jgi:hypothetical protein
MSPAIPAKQWNQATVVSVALVGSVVEVLPALSPWLMGVTGRWHRPPRTRCRYRPR